MSNSLPRVAFWLIPEVCARRELAKIINELASHYNAPVFLPHLTLYSCARTPRQAELAQSVTSALTTGPLTVRTTGVGTGEKLARTLYCKVQKEPALEAWSQALHGGMPHPSSYQFEPHLSLLYQALPLPVREQLARETRLSLDEITFDELRVVAIPNQIKTMDDFAGWQTLIIMALTG